jgi:hypothetical protein
MGVGGERREGRPEFTLEKASLTGLDFRSDKRRPPTESIPVEKPGKGRSSSLLPTHRFCEGG